MVKTHSNNEELQCNMEPLKAALLCLLFCVFILSGGGGSKAEELFGQSRGQNKETHTWDRFVIFHTSKLKEHERRICRATQFEKERTNQASKPAFADPGSAERMVLQRAIAEHPEPSKLPNRKRKAYKHWAQLAGPNPALPVGFDYAYNCCKGNGQLCAQVPCFAGHTCEPPMSPNQAILYI